MRHFVLPNLFEDGRPKYSHVIIYGDYSYLTKEHFDLLISFVDGTLDPIWSRLSHHEKETLPDLNTYNNNASNSIFK